MSREYNGECVYWYQIGKGKNKPHVPSLIAVHGAPSSCSNLISFRATKLSVSLRKAKKIIIINGRSLKNSPFLKNANIWTTSHLFRRSLSRELKKRPHQPFPPPKRRNKIDAGHSSGIERGPRGVQTSRFSIGEFFWLVRRTSQKMMEYSQST